jgi:DNA processing protein
VTVLRRRRPGYPERLLELHDPPSELHLCGGHPGLLAWKQPVVAIVGSRRAGEAGLGMARELARGAAAAGALVVSGLALGVDAAAHEGALAAGAPTLAVLGCGPDVAYPRTNRGLYARILAAGLIVSEYPPGTGPAPWRFPARNRLIAALADAVVWSRPRCGAAR